MTERQFWNERYFNGQNSGKGSVGGYRKWKWKVIKKFVNVKEKSVLDVGCGDLSFIRNKRFGDYLGLDISDVVIKKNRKKNPDKFAATISSMVGFATKDVTRPNESLPIRSQWDVVLCMDLLFHIMTDQGFENLLRNLNRWTGEYLFVVNWCKNPLPYLKDHYQHFRDLSLYFDWLTNLKLVDTFQRKKDPYNMIYVFRRR